MLSTHALRRSRLALVAGLLLATTLGAGAAVAQSPAAADPSAPVTGSPTGPDLGGAIPVVPDPAVTGEQPRAWESVTVGPDGRTLTVTFWNGAEACYGLKSVDVTVTDGVPTITLYTGMKPDAISKLCMDIAQLYSTVVVLDEPILLGGVS
jgi:hypothetical protein